MKKWISGVIILAVMISLGGWMYVDHASKETTYRTNLANGELAVKNQEYSKAKSNFKKALDVKPNSKKANGLSSQIEKFMDGQNELKSNDFASAESSFAMAAKDENGSADLANKAKQKVSLVKGIESNIKRYNNLYKSAVQQHNDKNYELSNATLNNILADTNISQSYYADVLAKAKSLKKSNDKSLSAAASVKTETQTATTNSANDTDTNNLSRYNVYTNPQEYANRWTENTNIANGPVSPNNDPYDVYTNPQEYANRFN